ncbi:MFS transporter [Longimycelium tulufanense]|uniref:MFS transporter n=1 Tax=Longimycelium tulufanense TaxID=907463 RepID=A0A8J3C706_9PSEU|nr:MFS transporter [Longimycelium tulufanense]GGM46007.1 MFS transporter [Longimycelium tulufanense]
MPGPRTRTASPRRWFGLALMSLSLLVIGLDATILAVALPTLTTDLNASTRELQWIVDAYSLTFASFLLPAGLLGDRYGRRAVLLLGFVIFGAASGWAAFSSDAQGLIAARALMGVGAAIITPLTLAMVPVMFPREERGKAHATWSVVSGIGLPLGPILGGWFLEHFWWGSVFLINIPILAIALIGTPFLVPESRAAEAPRVDLLGTLLSTAGLVLLVYGIIEGPHLGWVDVETTGTIVLGLVLLMVFVWWQARTDHPLLDLGLFRSRRFTWPTMALALVFLSLMGMLFVLTPYLQTVLGASPFGTGIRLLPLVAGLLLGAAPSDWLVKRFGAKLVIATGLFVLSAALLGYTRLTVGDSYQFTGTLLVAVGLGMGMTLPSSINHLMEALSAHKTGVGTAVNNAFRQVGAALGVALLGTIINTTYSDKMDSAAALLPPPLRSVVKDSIGAAHEAAARLGPAGDRLVAAANDAYVRAAANAALVAAIVCAVGFVVILLFLPWKPDAVHAPAEAQQEQAGQSDDTAVESSSSLP